MSDDSDPIKLRFSSSRWIGESADDLLNRTQRDLDQTGYANAQELEKAYRDILLLPVPTRLKRLIELMRQLEKADPSFRERLS